MIPENIELVNSCIYFKKQNILLVGDIHLGFEQSLHNEGILTPLNQFKETIENLNDLLRKFKKLNKIILIGDVKHDFGKTTTKEKKELRELFEILDKKCDELVIIKGNHDVILPMIVPEKKPNIRTQYVIDDVLITHGDKISETKDKIKTIIIGHEHPAISLSDGVRKELYKCFLVGKYKKYDLIVMPSFFEVTLGSDVLKNKLLSPYLNNIDDFLVYVVSEQNIVEFGTIKDIVKASK